MVSSEAFLKKAIDYCAFEYNVTIKGCSVSSRWRNVEGFNGSAE